MIASYDNNYFSIIKSPSDNDGKLREILNKWIKREEIVIEMCFNIVDKKNDDCHAKRTYD